MIRTAFEKGWAWWTGTACPWLLTHTVELSTEWCLDIAEKPRTHFVSMVAGGFIFLTLWISLG